MPLDVEAIRSAIGDIRLGRPLLYFPVIGSTSTHVMELARAGAEPGLLVIADEQTAGRGRIGRSWTSLPGRQLEFSLLLKPTFPSYYLVMASAVAVAEAIEAVAAIPAGIKWPNDVEVDGRKVCGILIETAGDIAVLGIGINVSGSLAGDPLLASTATTLVDAAGHDVSRELLLVDLLRRLRSTQCRPVHQRGFGAYGPLRRLARTAGNTGTTGQRASGSGRAHRYRRGCGYVRRAASLPGRRDYGAGALGGRVLGVKPRLPAHALL